MADVEFDDICTPGETPLLIWVVPLKMTDPPVLDATAMPFAAVTGLMFPEKVAEPAVMPKTLTASEVVLLIDPAYVNTPVLELILNPSLVAPLNVPVPNENVPVVAIDSKLTLIGPPVELTEVKLPASVPVLRFTAAFAPSMVTSLTVSVPKLVPLNPVPAVE
jgi:hypothetical protein